MPPYEIDRHAYDELRQTSGAEFIAELVDAFLEDAPQQIAELRASLDRHDAETFRRAAHSLKSNSATFGAHRMAEVARGLEISGKEDNLEGASRRINELESVYQKVAQELKELGR